MLTRKVFFLGLISVFLAGLALGGEAIPNWAAPATWSPARSHGGLTTMGDLTNPLPFIGVNPCRIVDTRNPAGPYGAPALAAGVPRNFTLTGQCGISLAADAVSLNITVTNTQGPGFILIYPQGGSQPTVSTLNYVANQSIANAAIVPLGAGNGGVTVIAGVSGTDLIIDTNGYYSRTPASQSSAFYIITNALGPAIVAETLSTSDSAAGIEGAAEAGTGTTYGVYGVTNSTTAGAAGVRGVVEGRATLAAYSPAGVRGESSSGYGVLGIVRSGSGVGGSLVDSTGTQIVYAFLAGTGAQNWAVYGGGDIGGTGAKFFVEPHPTDASRVIRYVSLEGPESGTYFRGTARTIHGEATIGVPESFRMVTDDEGLTVQVTPTGASSALYVESKDLNQIVVKASRDVTFDYLVQGVRRAFKDFEPVAKGTEFVPHSADEKMPLYLTEEAKRRLIANGTYNPDGTVNMETAERLGWAKIWKDREEQAKPAVATPKTE